MDVIRVDNNFIIMLQFAEKLIRMRPFFSLIAGMAIVLNFADYTVTVDHKSRQVWRILECFEVQ